MASLVLRGRVWHLAWRFRGKLKFQSTKVRHDGKSRNGKPQPPAAAKRELRSLEMLLDRGQTYEKATLSRLLELVEKDYEISGFKSSASLKSRVKHLRDWFGNLRADRITETDFTEYAEFRQKAGDRPGASNTTINRELEMLMKALRIGKIAPLPKLKKLPQPPPRKGFFDERSIVALMDNLPEYLRGPALFGYYTGWRREEVFGLEWSAVDFNAGEIRLWDSKNSNPRVFPMDAVPGLRHLLRRLADVAGDKPKSPCVFARTYKEKRRDPRRIADFRKAWASACRKAGCPGMTFHDLRRSAARHLELAGWPRSMVMAWMGHETESMYLRYRLLGAAERELIAQKVAEMLTKRGETASN